MPYTPLTDTEINIALNQLDGWKRVGDKIRKVVKLATYPQGLAYATAIGMLADGMNHHPDLLIGFKEVTIELTSHDAGHKISAKDIELAGLINALKIRV